ncbi:DUF4238 domain-containing protein [Aeromonas caviae]|uniref:DUF4238 domain-containing protein n=1 Tax=Aeromonas caviae TaxID=648 RepID=UPI002B48ABF8|nr:DUF4238 domain-containing protein [Aeromonas caviae]
MTIKRRHHYVWRKYLKAWAQGDLIWCLRNNNIFKSNLMGIAQERDFYKLNELSEADIDFIKRYIKSIPDQNLRNLCQGWAINFIASSELIRSIRAKYPEGENEEIDKEVDRLIYNTEEDLHSEIEISSIHTIEKLIARREDVFDNRNDYVKFIHYICTQYTRTNSMKQKAILSIPNTLPVDMSKVWNIFSHIIATSVGLSIIREEGQWSVVTLINQSSTPFITTDQPVINTFAAFDHQPEENHELELYYPLSPTIAILLTKKTSQGEREVIIDNQQADVYNSSMVSLACEQIFSSSKAELELLKVKGSDGK